MVYYRPDLIKYDQLLDSPSSYKDNLNNAFEVAEQELGLTKMLDAEGMYCTVDAKFLAFFSCVYSKHIMHTLTNVNSLLLDRYMYRHM